MKEPARVFLFGLLFLLISMFLGACGGRGNFNPNQITEIQTSADLSPELQEIKFYLFKHGDFGSKISIQTLDHSEDQLYHNPDYLSRVDVSPDMTDLVYVRMTSAGDIQPKWMWHVDLESGVERKIAGWDRNFDEISINNPGFSQDGGQVLFTVTWYDTGLVGLARVNLDGSGLEILDTDLPLNQGPEPSPDGSLIIVTCAGHEKIMGSPGFQLCLLDHDGKFVEFLTYRGVGHGSYYFLPDGESIVYSEYELGGIFGIINKPKNRFIIQDLQTGEFKELLNWEVGVLSFSLDGEEIVFKAKQNKKSPWRIYIMNIDGSNLRHLAYFDDFLDEWYADAREY